MRNQILLDNQFEYEIEKVRDTYYIYYNHGQQWSEDTRGTVAFKAVNTGNGYEISQECKYLLDYDEAFYLYLILRAEYKEYNIQTVKIK